MKCSLLQISFVFIITSIGILGDPDPSEEFFHRVPFNRDEVKCYDETGRAQRCIPPFENAAFNVLIEATNTCGESDRPTEFCKQTGVKKKSCEICRRGDHPALYLTDHDNNENVTWWQSQTMYDGIEYPNQVNLTLRLKKTFDITYVRVLFESPRPESWGIYRKKHEKSNWEPYQFYSATCRDTYGLPDLKETIRGEDTRVLCTSEYSDISPLTKGIVAFSTLEGRPSAYQFDTNPSLQEWVQASELKITLDRLNTFGDEVFGDDQVLKSYYYAIADIAVGARCTCNGHAGECVNSTAPDGSIQRICRCEHNTAGPDCNICLPFYNDAPWGRATTTDAHECKACNCNGYSDECYFDKDLYALTGHGGHCIKCKANRDGPNCEKCRDNYYQRSEDGYCIACNCNEIGSRSLQCNGEGKCQCKPGITGDKCDRCMPNFYNFDSTGCTSCDCNVKGSLGNEPSCDPITGSCACKENVEGKRCRECRPGFFNLALENEFGCTPCFCYGHASICRPASGYSKVLIESMFVRGNERWSANVAGNTLPLHYDAVTQTVSVSAPDRDNVYFVAPDRFLGDQRASYNQYLYFTLRIGEKEPAPTARDVILEGSNGEQITQPIFGQNNRLPTVAPQIYKFKLHEHPNYGWQPRLSARAFMSILSNLTSIKIRGTYTHQGRGFLDDVVLETAQRGAAGDVADWVEHCQCPNGYIGQFCESCAPGFHHDPPGGGPFAHCVPCNCNGHADICDAETGQCICHHNTAGSNCELCARGYYGYPLKGTTEDCKPCPCPDNGPCILLGNNPDPICSECPNGRTGPRCETCSDGYFGNPDQGIACRPCECNNNIDLNAVRNCNHETGECLKCVNNTAGFHCEDCLPGYWGDALSDRKEDGCKLCQCYAPGTLETDDGSIEPCNQLTGFCACKPHVTGKNCDKCEDGYYHILSGEGCKACNCDPEGSYNRTCDVNTGQCQCRPGVTGQRCDACQPYQYGFGREGCKHCDCDQIGSLDLQCDANGQCPCLTNVEGRRCDRCKENKYNRQYGCIDCPACYNLVQDAVNLHRRRLADLENTLNKINSSPTVIKDSDFEKELKNVENRVRDLLQAAKEGSGSDSKTLAEQLDDLRDQLNQIEKVSQGVDVTAQDARRTTNEGLTSIEEAESVLDKIHEQLTEAEDYLATEGATALEDARKRAEQVGQQNQQMTEIAQEARLLADLNVNEAKKIHILAEQAKNTSLDAYNLAKKAITRYSNISEEIRELENKLEILEDRFNEVKNLTATAIAKSVAVEEEALHLLILDLTLPSVDIQKLQDQVDVVNNDGLVIKERAQLLLSENEDLLNDLNEKIIKSEILLEKAQDQQAATADLLSEVDKANEKAQDAVKRGNQTLTEAQETLKKLGEFDAEVQKERIKAQEALKNIESIREMLDEAIEKADETQIILNGAENNAAGAWNITAEAQRNADEAGDNARIIRSEANRIQSDAVRLSNEADKLRARVEITDSIVKKYEIRVGDDVNVTNDVNHQVGQARNKVALASQQVDKALMEVSEIISELQALPEIDDADLDRLEKRLIAAEKEIKATNLDERIKLLTDAKNSQTQWVKNYEDEVSRLRIEVENIDEIRKALPTNCYKRLRLEP
ncbi:laminin subunit gamma-1 [Chelonus insularis]|uniref:laminin subunit gamma-1 n=1 Tax=Chelonus insularis TaxID=460826 RepID=UPI00158BCA08|nr:laminin subunit gamma-1 [Chelonus insularis]XP_034942262.1 laminin subunit gamma-1 [Chelonus insularis]XP_034942263.1 laminin subunit gamma-1 [Chelonus insularis]XP_034942264.1 laminin subunit gamma-1 [Chelonus insularis]